MGEVQEDRILSSLPAGGPPGEVPSRYRAHLLSEAKVTERGVVYRRGPQRFLLAWSRVRRALAAEVGEPQGVRTVVFDLVIASEGSECVACRFDADPGDDAMETARAIQLGIGADLCSPSLKNLVSEGIPTRSYPDLETFEEAALESVRFG